MKKRLYLIPLLIGFGLLNSCNSLFKSYGTYAKASNYHALDSNGESFTGIADIEIDWVAGDITFYATENDNIIIKETYTGNKEARIWENNKDLSVKFCGSGSLFNSNLSKNLEVYIPNSFIINKIYISSYSSKITIPNLNVSQYEIESISGNIYLDANMSNDIDIETVSGNINLLIGNKTTSVSIDTVSGNSVISCPEDILGFTIDFDSISGVLTDSFEAKKDENTYTYLNKDNLLIKVDSVSGSLTMASLKNN